MKKLIFKKFTKDISLFFFILIISVATIVWIIQAVNYLDLISEDGHSLRVYFSYTLFSESEETDKGVMNFLAELVIITLIKKSFSFNFLIK